MVPQIRRIAVAYIRVSTEGQALEGVSLDAQRDRIESWCTANGYELGTVHVDAGISGRRMVGRPGLEGAIAAATAKPGNALVVYSLSRLARSTKDMLAIAERLDRAGADLVSLTERIDTTTAAGRMVFRMLAVLAEFERDLIAERTRSALAAKKRRGECVGQVPFGYRRAGPRLVVEPLQRMTAAEVHSMRKRGLTLRAIAQELTQRGIPTAEGSRRWHPTTVRRILKREAA